MSAAQSLSILLEHEVVLTITNNGIETETDYAPIADGDFSTHIIESCGDPSGCTITYRFDFESPQRIGMFSLFAPNYPDRTYFQMISEVNMLNFYRRRVKLTPNPDKTEIYPDEVAAGATPYSNE